MGLFIWLELWLSIEMDAKGGHIHDSVLRVPEGRCQLVCIFSSVNNFTCKAEISIEPSSPKATSVALDIHLLESKLVVNLSVRGQFQNWGISMAPDNLVKVNPLINFVSKSKSYDSRLVPCVIVRFSSNQSPFVTKEGSSKLNSFLTYISLISLKPLVKSYSFMYYTAWKWETPEVSPVRTLCEYSLPSFKRACVIV